MCSLILTLERGRNERGKGKRKLNVMEYVKILYNIWNNNNNIIVMIWNTNFTENIHFIFNAFNSCLMKIQYKIQK